MHEADDAKDNQRDWLGPREGNAQNNGPFAKEPLLLRNLTLQSMREAKLWGSVGSKP